MGILQATVWLTWGVIFVYAVYMLAMLIAWYRIPLFKPEICNSNLLQSRIVHHLVTCSDFGAHRRFDYASAPQSCASNHLAHTSAFRYDSDYIIRVKRKNHPQVFFSLIIPARNEAPGIARCLESVLKQEYPHETLEVWVIDDHSADETAKLAENYIPAFAAKGWALNVIQNAGSGKKAAMHTAIEKTSGDWIISTDADTWRNVNWLAEMAAFIVEKDPVMVCGPVAFGEGRSIFQKWQTLEFAGLTGAGAAALHTGMPVMCNAANLAYQKSAFIEAGSFGDATGLASGDDVYLMQLLHKKFPGRVHFLKSNQATVYTQPCKDLPEFWNQRLRWATNGNNVPGFRMKLPAITVWLANFSVIYLTCVWILDAGFTGNLILSAWIFKTVPEFLFLLTVTNFYELKINRIFYWLFLPFYVIYIVTAGLMGSTGNFTWKNRTIQKGKWPSRYEQSNG